MPFLIKEKKNIKIGITFICLNTRKITGSVDKLKYIYLVPIRGVAPHVQSSWSTRSSKELMAGSMLWTVR